MTFWEISWQIIERYFRNVSEGERQREGRERQRETERQRQRETETDRHFKVLVKSHGDGDKFY